MRKQTTLSIQIDNKYKETLSKLDDSVLKILVRGLLLNGIENTNNIALEDLKQLGSKESFSLKISIQEEEAAKLNLICPLINNRSLISSNLINKGLFNLYKF